MKRQTRSEQIQNAIDTTLSGLKDDPRLAQRVIRAARQTETPKRKRFYGMVLAALLLLLAATAVAAAYLSRAAIRAAGGFAAGAGKRRGRI